MFTMGWAIRRPLKPFVIINRTQGWCGGILLSPDMYPWLVGGEGALKIDKIWVKIRPLEEASPGVRITLQTCRSVHWREVIISFSILNAPVVLLRTKSLSCNNFQWAINFIPSYRSTLSINATRQLPLHPSVERCWLYLAQNFNCMRLLRSLNPDHHLKKKNKQINKKEYIF